MSYRKDSWFGLEDAGESGILGRGEDADRVKYQNNPFRFPGGTRNFRNGKYQEIEMKRGYMRTITQGTGLDINSPMVKVNFQFNPATLSQSQQAETNVLDLVRMNPAQYSQPRQGNTNLAFNLKFDRSHELNNFRGSMNSSENSPSSRENPEDLKNEWSNDPSVVGVYHDIDALYRVIGQGAYEETAEFLQSVMNRRAVLHLNEGDHDEWTTPGAAGTADSPIASDGESNFNVRTGELLSEGRLLNNTAFLIPQPVRLVFSSLFVVEGYVMSSNVTYSRWTPSLVPIMADVALTIDAKDIGFAREKMFLTVSMEEAADNAAREVQDEIDAKQEAVVEALSMMSTAELGVVDIAGNLVDFPYPNTGNSDIPGRGHVLWHLDDKHMTLGGDVVDVYPSISLPFPYLHKSCHLSGPGDENKLKEFYENGYIEPPEFKYNVELYGPFDEDDMVSAGSTGKRATNSTVFSPKATVETQPAKHGNVASQLLDSQYSRQIGPGNFDAYKTLFSHEFQRRTDDGDFDLSDGAMAARMINEQRDLFDPEDNIPIGSVRRTNGTIQKIDRDFYTINGRYTLTNGYAPPVLNDDLKEEYYVYKWTLEGKVSFSSKEGGPTNGVADEATCKHEAWGYGTVSQLFDQMSDFGGQTREQRSSGKANNRLTMRKTIPLNWNSREADIGNSGLEEGQPSIAPSDSLVIRPQEAWERTTQPIDGDSPQGTPGYWVIHYPGSPNSYEPMNDTQMIAYLQAGQNDYLTNRGFSYGYSVVVSQSGSAWAVRGLEGFSDRVYNPASNPGRLEPDGHPAPPEGNFNDISRSIQIAVGRQNEASPAAVNTVNAIIATQPDWPVFLHKDTDPTDCAGVGISKQVSRGIIGHQTRAVNTETGAPINSSRNLPRVEAADGEYVPPIITGNPPRRRNKTLKGIHPNGAARSDKRKNNTPGIPSSPNPNKSGNGPSFSI